VTRGAEKIAQQFNHAASRLKGVEYGLNTSIQKDVVRANYHLHDIACFNKQIMETIAAGDSPDIWVSQRGRCLDALACCANFIATDTARGSVEVSIGGIVMVAGGENPDCLATFPDARGNLHLQAQNAGERLILNGGTIARKISVRDTQLAELQNGLHGLAGQLIFRVNSIYQARAGVNGSTAHEFFLGTNASDIAVNPVALGKDAVATPAPPAEEVNGRMVALALAKLGSREYLGLGHQTFRQNHAHGMSELEAALAVVQDSFNTGRPVSQTQALTAALDGETAGFMHYQQACDSTARMINALEKMSPMQ
jgi:flagellar hook-associated protein FlgK